MSAYDHLDAAREFTAEVFEHDEDISDDEALAHWAWNLLDDLHEGGRHEETLVDIAAHLREVGHPEATTLTQAIWAEIASTARR